MPTACRAFLLAALFFQPLARAQDGGTESELEALKRELEVTRQELKQLQGELRAQAAAKSAAAGWDEEWVEQKRELELFVPDGYFRVRPELFHKLDLGRAADPSGYTLFPRAPTDTGVPASQRTQAGVNMRFRFEPTFNVSEEVRLRLQLDALDNVLFGSTPEYAYSRSAAIGHAYDRQQFTLFSETQAPPRSMVNSLQDSISLKRIYGEVTTPVGILRFGRMGSHWGTGMLHHDGNCQECDFGNTVDRLMFVTEPLEGIFVTPMLDFDAEGPSSVRQPGGGQPFDLSNTDDAYSVIVAVARRDTEQQARAKLANHLHVFNYGLHLSYRVQGDDPAELYAAPFQGEGQEVPAQGGGYVSRKGTLVIPDLWAKYERQLFNLEVELAAVLGSIGNRAQTGADAQNAGQNQGLTVMQFGGVARGEYRFLEGSLLLKGEVGFASGDSAPGFGNYPRRKAQGPDGETQPGDIDGPQYACASTGGCRDNSIRNFRFNRDYRIDLVLWREILGSVTDALYVKPTLEYKLAAGLNLYASVIYSRAMFAQSTPSWDGTSGVADLGVELNGGARYQTEDGFFATVDYGILAFPLGGLNDSRLGAAPLDGPAQVLRGALGVKF